MKLAVICTMVKADVQNNPTYLSFNLSKYPRSSIEDYLS